MSLTADLFAANQRNALYGNGRALNAGRQVKGVMGKTSVLNDGEYNFQQQDLKKGVWTSVTKVDYKGNMPEKTGLQYSDKNLQLKQHFELGNDSGPLLPNHTYKLSETMETYTGKEGMKPHVHKPTDVINWTDMSPQFMTQSFMKNSEYDSAYKSDKMPSTTSGPLYPKLDTSKLQLPLPTNELTHGISVSLGNDHRRMETEAGYAYNQSADFKSRRPGSSSLSEKLEQTRQITKFMKKMEQNSNVFRKGDYNDAKQSMASTHAVDYSRRNQIPASFKLPQLDGTTKGGDEEVQNKLPSIVANAMANGESAGAAAAAEKKYHTTAHFQLGNHGDTHKSVYNKDFLPNQKAVKNHHSRPKDSEVLQKDEDAGFGETSTNVFFSKNPTALAKMMNPDREAQTRKNMARRHGNNVVFSYDPSWHASERQSSLNHDTFKGPPSNFKPMEPLVTEGTKFNFLHSDGVWKQPPGQKTTEAQDNFKGYGLGANESTQRLRTKDAIGKERVENGREAHFVFGDDPKIFKTEHGVEFSGRPKMDQNVAPAGKKEIIPEFSWTHINTSDNTQDFKPDPYRTSNMESLISQDWYVTRSQPSLPVHNSSVMKSDYRSLDTRGLTGAQIRQVKAADKLIKPIEQSHFFHTDTSKRDNWTTTNRFDFVKPEAMSGKIYLEAR